MKNYVSLHLSWTFLCHLVLFSVQAALARCSRGIWRTTVQGTWSDLRALLSAEQTHRVRFAFHRNEVFFLPISSQVRVLSDCLNSMSSIAWHLPYIKIWISASQKIQRMALTLGSHCASTWWEGREGSGQESTEPERGCWSMMVPYPLLGYVPPVPSLPLCDLIAAFRRVLPAAFKAAGDLLATQYWNQPPLPRDWPSRVQEPLPSRAFPDAPPSSLTTPPLAVSSPLPTQIHTPCRICGQPLSHLPLREVSSYRPRLRTSFTSQDCCL